MNAPKKSALYERINELEKAKEIMYNEKEIGVLQEKMRAEGGQQKQWADSLPEAYEVFWKFAKASFSNGVTKVKCEHVDAAGYWFSYELAYDSRRQTYAVRHTDIECSRT